MDRTGEERKRQLRRRAKGKSSLGRFVAQPPALKPPQISPRTLSLERGPPSSIFRADPSVVHFGGFTVGRTHEARVRIINMSRKGFRMVVHPTTTPYFEAFVEPQGVIAPGMAETVLVTFRPDDHRYYFDVLRVQSDDDTLVVPLHGYPVVQRFDFPRRIDFGACELRSDNERAVVLESGVPVDFEFRITVTREHPNMHVEPLQGVIPGNGKAEVRVSFHPTEAATCFAELEVDCSQYNFKPIRCEVVGSSAAGLTLGAREEELDRRLRATTRTLGLQRSTSPHSSRHSSPTSSLEEEKRRAEEEAEEGADVWEVGAKPVDVEERKRMWRTRHAHGAGAARDPGGYLLETRRLRRFQESQRQRSERKGGGEGEEEEEEEDEEEAERMRRLQRVSVVPPGGVPAWGKETIQEGIRVPENVTTTHALNFVLTQEEGKLKPRDLPQAIAARRRVQRERARLQSQMMEEQRQGEGGGEGEGEEGRREEVVSLSKHQKAVRVSLSLPAMIAEERAGRWLAQMLGSAHGARVPVEPLLDLLRSIPDHASLRWHDGQGLEIDLGNAVEAWEARGLGGAGGGKEAASGRKLREMVFLANVQALEGAEVAREFQAKGVWWGERPPSQASQEAVRQLRSLWTEAESRLLGIARRRRRFLLALGPHQQPPFHTLIPLHFRPSSTPTFDPRCNDPWKARRRTLLGLRSLVDRFLVEDRARERLKLLRKRLADARRSAGSRAEDSRTAMEDLIQREARSEVAGAATARQSWLLPKEPLDEAAPEGSGGGGGGGVEEEILFQLEDFRQISPISVPTAPVLPEWDSGAALIGRSAAKSSLGASGGAAASSSSVPEHIPTQHALIVFPSSFPSFHLPALPPSPLDQEWDLRPLPPPTAPTHLPADALRLSRSARRSGARDDPGPQPWIDARISKGLRRAGLHTTTLPPSLVFRPPPPPRPWLLHRDPRSRMLPLLEERTEDSPDHLLDPRRTLPTVFHPAPHALLAPIARACGRRLPPGSALARPPAAPKRDAKRKGRGERSAKGEEGGEEAEEEEEEEEDDGPRPLTDAEMMVEELDPNGLLLTRSQLFLGSIGWHSLRAEQGRLGLWDVEPVPVGRPTVDLVSDFDWGPYQFAVIYHGDSDASVHPSSGLPGAREVPERRREGGEEEGEGESNRWAEARREVVRRGTQAGLGGKGLLPAPAATQSVPLHRQLPPASHSWWELPNLPPHLPGPLKEDAQSDDSESDVEERAEGEREGGVPIRPGWGKGGEGEVGTFPTLADAAFRFGRVPALEDFLTDKGREHVEQVEREMVATGEAGGEEVGEEEFVREMEGLLAEAISPLLPEGHWAKAKEQKGEEGGGAGEKEKAEKGKGKGKEKEKEKGKGGAGKKSPRATGEAAAPPRATDRKEEEENRRDEARRAAWAAFEAQAVPPAAPLHPDLFREGFRGPFVPEVTPFDRAALTRAWAEDSRHRSDVDCVAGLVEMTWNAELDDPREHAPIRTRVAEVETRAVPWGEKRRKEEEGGRGEGEEKSARSSATRKTGRKR